MATTEQFSLRWNNFHSNLSAGFHDLLEAADMVDVTLAIDGHFLQAHKIVLSICSPYFKEMFKINPCKHPIVILKDVSHENMKDILQFMYTGEVNVLRENLPIFLRTAELLQVKGLTGDDSSDTSSRKDDKSESVCDNEEDDIQTYNDIIEQDPNLLQQFTQSDQPKQSNPSYFKRPMKASPQHQSSKRTKSDYNSNQSFPTSVKLETSANDGEEFDEYPSQIDAVKLENDDQRTKDLNTRLIENSNAGFPQIADGNSQDQATCTACGKIMRKSSIRRHMLDVHIPTEQLPCDICHKFFKTANSLTTHLITIHRVFKSTRHRTKQFAVY